MMFVGVDPTASHHPLTYAILDQECNLVLLSAGEFEDLSDLIDEHKAVYVAINAPPRPNIGLVRKMLERKSPSSRYLRGADIRLAEYELRERGILISPTPSRSESCPAWMQMGFELYKKLEGVGFVAFPADKATHQQMETHPHAAFCALLGQTPLPKPTLEGRLQRQLVLHEHVIGIKDPMDIFEEITRHKLLKGILPMELVYAAEELDALVAALTAFLSVSQPECLVLLGDSEEGQIVLPVSGLKDSYS
jgi:hypothetical protein